MVVRFGTAAAEIGPHRSRRVGQKRIGTGSGPDRGRVRSGNQTFGNSSRLNTFPDAELPDLTLFLPRHASVEEFYSDREFSG